MSKELTQEQRGYLSNCYFEPDDFEVRTVKVRAKIDLFVLKTATNEQISETALLQAEQRLAPLALGGKFKVTAEVVE